MEQRTEYIRTFSALEGLQNAHQLSYRMRRQDDAWRLELETRTKTSRQSEALLLRCPEQTAHDLFLYENSIPLENWRDVVAEAVSNAAAE